jgi:hypothetical protein
MTGTRVFFAMVLVTMVRSADLQTCGSVNVILVHAESYGPTYVTDVQVNLNTAFDILRDQNNN